MSFVAILGAGNLGAAIAHKLAERDRFREVRLIDPQSDAAAGKALDIQQSAPIGGYHTRVRGERDPLAAGGASAVVIADTIADGEWDLTRGSTLIDQLTRAGVTGPFVFAGSSQVPLMKAVAGNGRIKVDRLVATAPSAMIGAAAALISLEWDGAASDISLIIAGRPPRFVVGWSSASVGGTAIESRVPAHRLLAISDSLNRLWPAGPQSIAAATAPVVEALVFGSRRLHQAAVILDGEFGGRGVAGMLPLELGHGRIKRRVIPSLTPMELGAVQKSLK